MNGWLRARGRGKGHLALFWPVDGAAASECVHACRCASVLSVCVATSEQFLTAAIHCQPLRPPPLHTRITSAEPESNLSCDRNKKQRFSRSGLKTCFSCAPGLCLTVHSLHWLKVFTLTTDKKKNHTFLIILLAQYCLPLESYFLSLQ